MIKTGRGEHRSSADFFWEQLLKQVGASIARPRTANGSPYFLISLLFFYVDYLPEQTIVRHDFVLLILFSRWRRLFVTANYFVQFSKLKFNDIFTCVRWRMDSGRGEHRSSADCQRQPLLSYITALFSRWLFARTDYCAAWLCPPHPLLTLEKAFCCYKLFCSAF